MMKIASTRAKEISNVSFSHGRIIDLPFRNKTLNHIISFGVRFHGYPFRQMDMSGLKFLKKFSRFIEEKIMPPNPIISSLRLESVPVSKL